MCIGVGVSYYTSEYLKKNFVEPYKLKENLKKIIDDNLQTNVKSEKREATAHDQRLAEAMQRDALRRGSTFYFY